ncbi:alpha/beta hydrolase [Leucobacter sp. W1478]|uniref:alpha/beta hydrolase n=1 Tax=Leucobacter sp. W1478 TaxID=3439065 RepID=UPI003F301508
MSGTGTEAGAGASSAAEISGRVERGSRRGRVAGGARRRVGIATVALAAVAALTLSGCAPLFELAQNFASRATDRGPSAEFERFEEQDPKWKDCGDGLECAQVFAPLDWSEPGGERITLAMIRQPALSGSSQGSLFVNPGGPGASGVDYVRAVINGGIGDPLRQNFDIVGWDPRGTGASSSVTCLEAEEMDEFLFSLGEGQNLERGSDEWIALAAEESAAFGEACLEATGPLLGHVDTMSTVMDLDMLRAIVGDEKLNYLGFSYGTYIGARYADTYPDRVGRLVLDGATDPTASEADVVREQTLGFEAALRAYVTDCLSRESCLFAGKSVDESMAHIGALIDQVDQSPIEASDGRMLGTDTMLTAIITPLYAQVNWPYLDDLFAGVEKGDAETAFLLADFYYDRVDGVYQTNLMEAFLSINCLDYPRDAELDVERMRAQAAELDAIAPTIGRFQGYGDTFCANWPETAVESRDAVRASGADPILVVGTTGDPATPYRWSVSLADQLESGVLVTYHGEGHTAYGEHPCVNAVIDEYFVSGKVPVADPNCAAS